MKPDTTQQVRTDEPGKAALAIVLIREALDAGYPVYVDLIDRITRYPLLLTPKDGLLFWGAPSGVPGEGWYVLSWIEHGSMWTNFDNHPHWTYVAEKLRLRADFDQVAAETLATFMEHIALAKKEGSL